MALPVTIQNKTKIYNVSGYDSGKLPEWLIQKHRKKLKKDIDYGRRIELVQEFEFPEASNRIQLTRNEKFIVSTGVYKPQIRVFDLEELSIKFERHTDSETIAFSLLEDDWSKLALLQSNKSVEFHTQGGIYYNTAVPLSGRDMYYDTLTCDVLVGGNTSSICRLNIETGRFNSSIETSYSSINKLELNPLHRLLAVGSGSSPLVSYVDMRTRKTVGSLNMSAFSLIENDAVEVSSLKFLPNGLSLAVGTSNGIVLLFDLRSNKPYAQRDHSYGLPIKTITYHEQERYILSADSKIVKIWRPTEDSIADGDEESPLLASVEPPHTINDLCLQQGTGFFMLANEGSQIQSFYIPSLGPAPKWCAFLDNLTEELEENPQPVVYDNYKFVTRADLATLGIEHLIGTSTLRAYMHGFFMDFRLYEKAKSIQNPFAFEEYRERQLMEKIELQRASRIHASALKKLPKVNRALAEKLLKKTGLDLTQRDKSSNDLLDTRFKEIFEDEDFMVDETSREYAMLHPTEAAAKGSEAVNSIHVKSQHEDDVEEDEEDDDVVDPKVAVAFPPNRPRHLTHKPKGSRSASGGGSSTSRGGSRYTSAKNSTDRSHRGSARGPSKGTSRGTSKGANRR